MLFGGGLLAGIINTLAGNGSAITLSLLIFTGQSATVANATNRLGALSQTLTAVLSLRRTKRTRFLLREARWFLLPASLGSLLGAWLAIDIDPQVLRRVIGLFMLLLLFSLLYKPSQWTGPTQPKVNKRSPLTVLLIFLVAVYGGFIQMGIGIMLLSILVLLARYSLRDANIVKLLLAMLFVIPAFGVFVLSGDIQWRSGLALAAGQGLGAWWAARYVLYSPLANVLVKWLLVVILSLSSLTLLGILDWFKSWLL